MSSDGSRGSSFLTMVEKEKTPEKVPWMLRKRSTKFGTVVIADNLGVIWISSVNGVISPKYWRNCSSVQRVGYATVIGKAASGNEGNGFVSVSVT